MRILNVTAGYAPFYEFGGPPVKVQALSEGLIALGHSVTVLTADWGLKNRLQEMPSLSSAERSPLGWQIEQDGIRAVYLRSLLHYRALSWNPSVKRFSRTSLKNFDVVHIFGLYDLLGPSVAGYCRKLSLPYLIEPMGMFVPIVRSLPLKKLYHAFYGKRLFAGAAALIATSEQEVEELLRGGIARDKIILRRNGITAPGRLPPRGSFRAAQNVPLGARLILFLGRLSLKKSPEMLLQAFASLPAQIMGKELYLVFAGPDEGGMKSRLATATVRAGIATRVRFPGPLYADQKWAAYLDADLFVLPSQNENFGNTALEAAAVGTPAIVTENCGIAPLLDGVAAMVIPHEQNALVRSIERILTDSQLHARLAAGGKEIVSRLGWDEPVRRMESLYTSLAAPKPAVGESISQE
jgi:glycosyltransferase involved in cell wall biosynthesis